MKIIASLIALLFVSSIHAVKYCNLAPYQRAEADIPVYSSQAALPPPYRATIIIHVVNYDSSIQQSLPADKTHARLHSHIWLVDQQNCKNLAILPLPDNASFNVHGVEFDAQALPVQKLDNGNILLRYAFATPDDINTVVVRSVVLNHLWKPELQNDIKIKTNQDARKVVNIANWHISGNMLVLSEPSEKFRFLHHVLVFNESEPKLYRYQLGHPQAHMITSGFIVEESKAFKSHQYYPRYAVITSFDAQIQSYRQFAASLPNPATGIPHYIYLFDKNGQTLIQLGKQYVSPQGVALNGQLLNDYVGSDQLHPEDISAYRWQNGRWIRDNQLRPKRIMINKKSVEDESLYN